MKLINKATHMSILFISVMCLFNILPQKVLAISIPIVTTNPPSALSQTGATVGGTIVDNGGDDVSARGINYRVWGSSDSYNILSENTGPYAPGSFDKIMSSLACNTRYEYYAYATNLAGTGTGIDTIQGVTTSPCISRPTVSNTPVTSITKTSAVFNGEITNTGGADASARGFVYLLASNWNNGDPDNGDLQFLDPETGTFGIGSFTTRVTGLTCATDYIAVAFADNSAGVGFAVDNPAAFTTKKCHTPSSVSGSIYSPSSASKSVVVTTIPIVQSAVVATRTLKFGLDGDDVKTLQLFLNMNVLPKNSLTPDGKFGLKTKAAVIQFQKTHDLFPDGSVGPKTRAKIK